MPTNDDTVYTAQIMMAAPFRIMSVHVASLMRQGTRNIVVEASFRVDAAASRATMTTRSILFAFFIRWIQVVQSINNRNSVDPRQPGATKGSSTKRRNESLYRYGVNAPEDVTRVVIK
jgi:hypothetical protein